MLPSNKSFYNIGVLNAEVMFSEKLSKFKLDATIFVSFSLGLHHQGCKTKNFVRNESQCDVTD